MMRHRIPLLAEEGPGREEAVTHSVLRKIHTLPLGEGRVRVSRFE